MTNRNQKPYRWTGEEPKRPWFTERELVIAVTVALIVTGLCVTVGIAVWAGK